MFLLSLLVILALLTSHAGILETLVLRWLQVSGFNLDCLTPWPIVNF